MNLFISSKLASIRTTPTSLLAILIYSAGVVGFTTWTIVDFIPLLDEYRNQNVDTRVAISRNDTAWPPDLTVCIPYYSDSLTKISKWLLGGALTNSCMECDALVQHGWNVWADFNSTMIGGNVEATKTQLAIYFMRRIVNESTTNGLVDILTLNRSNFNWNQPLLDAVWKFLSDLLTADVMFVFGRPITGLAAEIVVDGDLLDELFVRSLAAIEIYFQRRVTFTYGEVWRSAFSAVPMGNSTSPSYFGICLRASNSAMLESFRFVAFESDELDPPWIRTPRSKPFVIYMDDQITYGTVSIIEGIYATETSDMQCNHETVYLDFKIDLKVVEARPNSECIRNATMLHCAISRFAENVRKECSCLPFGFKNIFPSMRERFPYCTSSAYSKCSSSVFTLETALSFLDSCSKQCEIISRQSNHIAFAEKDEFSRDLIFEILFGHQPGSPYVEFSIVVKTSWQKFVSNIGGTVGIYLGFSGLSIVAVFAACMERLGDWLKSGRGTTTIGEDGRNGNRSNEMNPTEPAVDPKRLLSANDITEMIRYQQQIAREEMMGILKMLEERIAATECKENK